MTFVLKQFPIGPMQNFCYLIGDEKTKKAFVVDPAWAPEKIVETVKKEGFTLAGLIVSHAHYDHTNAIDVLLDNFDIPVYAQKEEVAYARAGHSIVGRLGATVKALDGEETVQLGETALRFIPTPGHTPGSQCVQVGHNLITGDTLFIGGCGRSDLPGGDPEKLFQSLQKIAKLPSELVVCPGHDYGVKQTRSLGDEKKDNPYLQTQTSGQFLEAMD